MTFKYLTFLLTFCVIHISLSAQDFIAGTFNIRYQNPSDSGNLWTQRAPQVIALVRFHQFDIFGTQAPGI